MENTEERPAEYRKDMEYFSYLFTIQLAFLPYFPYHFTMQPTFLPHFPYLFTIQLGFLPYTKGVHSCFKVGIMLDFSTA
jgi:hypothetical protein